MSVTDLALRHVREVLHKEGQYRLRQQVTSCVLPQSGNVHSIQFTGTLVGKRCQNVVEIVVNYTIAGEQVVFPYPVTVRNQTHSLRGLSFNSQAVLAL